MAFRDVLIVAVLVGILLAVLEGNLKGKTLVPSPTGLGIGMLVPASVIVTMVVGGLIATVEQGESKDRAQYLTPLASGPIAGEALIAVVVPLLVVCGLLGT